MAAYFKKYFYEHKENRQIPLADLISELTRRIYYELSNITMNSYQYIVSTFPQMVILLFIFLTYYYIKKARKGRQTKLQDSIDIHRTKQKCNFSDNLSKLLPQHFRNHVTNDPSEATNVSRPRVSYIDTEPTVSAIHHLNECDLENMTTRTPCTPQITKYNPLTDKFDIWIANFESYMKEHNNEVSTWINVLKHMLTDPCKEQILFMFRKPGATYDEIKRNISLMYNSNQKGAEDTLKIFCERKKKPNETYYQFAAHLEQLAVNAHIPDNQLQSRTIERFIEGIPATLKLEIMRQYNNRKPDNIYDLIETVMSIERINQQLADEAHKNQPQYSTEYFSDEACALEGSHLPQNTNDTQEPPANMHRPYTQFNPHTYGPYYYQPLQTNTRNFSDPYKNNYYKNKNRSNYSPYPQQRYQQLYPNNNSFQQLPSQPFAHQPQYSNPVMPPNQNNPQHLYQLTNPQTHENQPKTPTNDGGGLNK